MGKVFVLMLALAIIITVIAMDSRLTVMNKCLNLLTKNEQGEHDQVRTHTPHMYEGGLSPSSAIPLDRRLSGNFTATTSSTSSQSVLKQPGASTSRVTPKPAPTPTPKPSITNRELAKKIPDSIPKFDTRQSEQKWLKENNLDSKIHLGNIDDSTRSNVIKAYVKMGKEYPDIVLNNSINTFDSRGFPLNVIDKLVGNGKIDNTFGFAISAYVPNTGILLNERYFSDVSEFNKSYKNAVDNGWHPAASKGAETEILVSHELSHAIYAGMPEEKKKKWLTVVNNPAVAAFFTGSNSVIVPGLSNYAKTDPAECFSEALSAYYYGGPKYKANPLVLAAYSVSKE